MRIQKAIAAILAAAVLTCMSGCGSKSGGSSGSAPQDTSVSGSGGDNSTPGGDNSTPGGNNNTPSHDNEEINITSAADLVKQMKVGWNLGNTLDALGGEGLTAETAWGNPVTTKEMIDQVKEAGFNVLRVPVSWGAHLDEQYNIDAEWLDRVQEVVNYGIDNDMFVILNTHHEEWYMPKTEDAPEDLKQLEKLWTQIAERFKGYNEKLLFEGVNEPRLRGDQKSEWTGTKEARGIINQYAETFVKAVRATGGNNAERALLITPYAASSMAVNLRSLKVPENAGNIIVSVHAYLPYDFALNTQGTVFYEKDGSVDNLMKDIKSIFLDKDIPVVITEFGAMNKGNTEGRLQCVEDYLTAAKKIGVPCVWWDNNAKSGPGENFGLLNRAEGGWYFPEIVDKIMETVGE